MELYHSNRRNAGLDGLRGLAVLAVIGYHLFPNVVAGGYLGVVVFFVLSGYLIGDSLLYRDTPLPVFWKKRFLRLFPSLAAMMAGITLVARLFAPTLLRNSLAEAATALTYTHNWWQIAQGHSYFTQYLSPSLWTHLWSLAIEVQFYLLIPLLIVAAKRYIGREKAIGLLLVVLLAASAIWMGWLYRPGTDPSRLYYGTDTRLFSLLVGVVGACFMPMKRRHLGRNQAGLHRSLPGLGALATILMLAAFWLVGYRMEFVYYGGMLVFSCLVLILILALRDEDERLTAVFSFWPLRYLGSRSYALYLWQYPLMVLLQRSAWTADWPPIRAIMVQLVVLLLVAELSYLAIEAASSGPFHPIESWYRYFRRRNEWTGRGRWQRIWVALPYGLTLAAAVTAVVIWLWAPRGESDDIKRLKQAISSGEAIVEQDAEAGRSLKEAAPTDTSKQTTAVDQTQNTETNTRPENTEASVSSQNTETNDPAPKPSQAEVRPTAADLETAKQQSYLLIGDSIMLSDAVALKETFPQSRMVAEVGLQLYQAEEKLAELGAEAWPTNIVIALGTNAPVSDEVLESLVVSLQGHHLYLVTVEGSVSHKDRINRQLAEAAKANDHVTLIDWAAYASGHKDWFYEDSVHPNEVGVLRYHEFLSKMMIDNYR